MRSVTISAGVLFLATTGAHAVNQSDIASTGGDTARSFLGRGRHVIIGILDGGIDVNHPAIRGSVVASRDFSGSGTTDDDRNDAGHATGLASLYVGHASDFTGLAPKAGIINARVITNSDYTDDRMAGNGLFYSLDHGAKVINMSFGNKLGDGPMTGKFNLMVDYAAENYGASMVSAAGNDDDTAVAQVPAGAFNGYSVGSLQSGRFNTVSSFSNFALKSDQRSKPDLVAPGENVQRAAANWEKASPYLAGSGTSFSTPIIGGVLAQMVGYGQDHNLPTDPRLLKAIVMTSADKEYDNNGNPWTPRHSVTDRKGRVTYDQPLDAEQGAGRIDAMGAYKIYARKRDSSTPVVNWAYASMRRLRSYVIDLGNLVAGQRIDSTLVWNHHVGRTDDGDGVVDATDKFYEIAPIADFALTLAVNGRNIAASDSNVDNLEQLSYRLTRSGHYTLEVFRYGDGGTKRETFAVAAHVLNNPPALRSLNVSGGGLLADGSSNGVSRSLDNASLASTGDTLTGATAVPEPSTAGLMMTLAGAACARRRRRV